MPCTTIIYHIAQGTHNSLSPNLTESGTLHKEKEDKSTTSTSFGNVGAGAAEEEEGSAQIHVLLKQSLVVLSLAVLPSFCISLVPSPSYFAFPLHSLKSEGLRTRLVTCATQTIFSSVLNYLWLCSRHSALALLPALFRNTKLCPLVRADHKCLTKYGNRRRTHI